MDETTAKSQIIKDLQLLSENKKKVKEIANKLKEVKNEYPKNYSDIAKKNHVSRAYVRQIAYQEGLQFSKKNKKQLVTIII